MRKIILTVFILMLSVFYSWAQNKVLEEKNGYKDIKINSIYKNCSNLIKNSKKVEDQLSDKFTDYVINNKELYYSNGHSFDKLSFRVSNSDGKIIRIWFSFNKFQYPFYEEVFSRAFGKPSRTTDSGTKDEQNYWDGKNIVFTMYPSEDSGFACFEIPPKADF